MSDKQNENRTNIEDLPTPETELTKEEAEKVSGGGTVSPVHLDLLGVVDPRRSQEQNKVVVDPNNPNTVY